MANSSSKPFSEKSEVQVLQSAINDADKTLGVSGYATSKVGAKIHITNFQVNPAIDDYRFLDIVQTMNGTTSVGFPTVTGLTNAQVNLKVGQYIFGSNIPENTTILTIVDNQSITMSNNASGSGNIQLKFANLLILLRLIYDTSSRTNLVDTERLQ